MSKTVFFLNMFPDYQPPEPILGMFSQAAITAADIDPERRSVIVEVASDTYIPQKLLQKCAGDIADAYDLRSLQIEPVYPASQLQAMDSDDLMQLFVSENSMTRGSLAGANWSWNDKALHIGNVLKYTIGNACHWLPEIGIGNDDVRRTVKAR